jgi:outer membrane protein assembly factor BamB
MLRRLVCFGAIVAAILFAKPAKAQERFPADLIPRRTALERLGLERQWFGVIPLVESERLLRIAYADGLLFTQTSYAMLHTFDAESGRLLWSAQLGERTGFARGVTANSFAVFVTNADTFFALDRRTGRPIWKYDFGTIPTSAPVCNEELAIVGLTTGKVFGFTLKHRDDNGKETILTSPQEAWNWQTGGPMLTRPLPAQNIVAFGDSEGKVYVMMSEERTPLFRIATGGAIGQGMGTYGTRFLLVPSADNNLYAVDIFTADVAWTFASGAPIEQEPIVADQDLYSVNTAGICTSLDPPTGNPRWRTNTQGGQLVAVSGSKVYLRSQDLDLFFVERATGRMLIRPTETFLRAGLNLRDYKYFVVNRFNDRMYFATPSGMIVCLREAGQVQPRLLKDPKAHPFSYVPPEGIRPKPVAASPEETKTAPEEGAEAAPGEKKEKPDADEEKEKPADKEKSKPAEKAKPADQEKNKPADKGDE